MSYELRSGTPDVEAYLRLRADSGRALHAKHGFIEAPESSAGMGLWNGRIRR